jgi:cytochrome c oxidase assembly factor CtaG
MEHTKNKTTTYNNLSETRFKTLLVLMRTAGIQLNMMSVPKVNAVCNIVLISCFYVTIVCLNMDSFVNRHDLVKLMKKFRILLELYLFTWIHFSLR